MCVCVCVCICVCVNTAGGSQRRRQETAKSLSDLREKQTHHCTACLSHTHHCTVCLSHTHTHALSPTHTHALSCPHPHTHTLTLPHTHTLTHSLGCFLPFKPVPSVFVCRGLFRLGTFTWCVYLCVCVCVCVCERVCVWIGTAIRMVAYGWDHRPLLEHV